MEQEYIKRRQEFIAKLPKNSITLLFAGCEVRKTADECFIHQVDHNFFYLTGIRQENSVLLVKKENGLATTYLLIDEFDALKEVWTGIRIKNAEAQNISGIANIVYTKELNSMIISIIEDNAGANQIDLCLDASSASLINNELRIKDFSEQILSNNHKLKYFDVSEILIHMRMIKSDYEIAEIKKAISMTDKAIREAIKEVKPGNYEFQVAARFNYEVMLNQYARLAFNTIAASGVNATILHYPHPIAKMNDNELILLDLGADNIEYKADISRTFPINGKFNNIQRKIYQIVLDTNKAAIKFARPGLTLKDLQTFTCEFLAANLISEGIIGTAEELKKYYYHNVSHHLGLDTHDICVREALLKPGMVITIEPGLYIKEYAIGIRIEDDILITETGAECLSAGIPKEIDEIERMMK